MTVGKPSRNHQARKKIEAELAAAYPQRIKCQKCRNYGHRSAQCTVKRKIIYSVRKIVICPARTKIVPKSDDEQPQECSGEVACQEIVWPEPKIMPKTDNWPDAISLSSVSSEESESANSSGNSSSHESEAEASENVSDAIFFDSYTSSCTSSDVDSDSMH